MAKLKVGVIGIGKMGKIHTRVLSELNSCDLVGIYDLNDSKELHEIARLYNTTVYGSLDKLIDDADALVISTPTTTHKEIALKAIKKGKHILVEKPLAENSTSAEEIYREAKRYDVKLMVGHVERFNPVIQKLKEILEERKPLIISITRVGPFPPRIKDTGIILDLSIHDIDILQFLLGFEPEKICCFKSQTRGKYEDVALISFKFHDCLAHIVTNWLTPFKVRKIEVATETDYFVGDLINQKLTKYSKYTEEGAYVAHEIPIFYKEPIKAELEEFINAIIEDREPTVDGEAAIKNISVAEKCLLSEEDL